MSMGMSYADAPTPMNDWERKEKERKEAMKKRLEKLPKNPVTETAQRSLNKQLGEKENRDKWEAVDSLVSAAYGQFCDGDLTFDAAVKSLGESIAALAGVKK